MPRPRPCARNSRPRVSIPGDGGLYAVISIPGTLRAEAAPEPQPHPERRELPSAPGLLPLDRRVMSWWPRWRDGSVRRSMLAQHLQRSLERLETNLAAIAEEGGWGRTTSAGGYQLRQGTAHPRRLGAVEQLLDGFALQAGAISDVIRASGLEGHAALALEKALKGAAQAVPALPSPVREPAPSPTNDPAGSPPEANAMTMAQQVIEELERRGIDWLGGPVSDEIKHSVAAQFGTTAGSVGAALARARRDKASSVPGSASPAPPVVEGEAELRTSLERAQGELKVSQRYSERVSGDLHALLQEHGVVPPASAYLPNEVRGLVTRLKAGQAPVADSRQEATIADLRERLAEAQRGEETAAGRAGELQAELIRLRQHVAAADEGKSSLETRLIQERSEAESLRARLSDAQELAAYERREREAVNAELKEALETVRALREEREQGPQGMSRLASVAQLEDPRPEVPASQVIPVLLAGPPRMANGSGVEAAFALASQLLPRARMEAFGERLLEGVERTLLGGAA